MLEKEPGTSYARKVVKKAQTDPAYNGQNYIQIIVLCSVKSDVEETVTNMA